MDRKEFIEHLNRDLMLEYQSIVQYVSHIATVKGAQYQQTVAELASHLTQEVEHAKIVAQQVDFLGGCPTTNVPAEPPKKDAEAALLDDLELEREQLDRYRERIEQARELGLPDVAEALAPVLKETQDHIRDLEATLWRPTGIPHRA
jgi:bacterioferritin